MKGQTQQVFIYIMVILIVGAVLLFGYKSINKLITQSCNLDQVTFQNNLRDVINGGSNYGDDKQETIKAPCGYERLCFMDAKAITDTSYAQTVGIATINPNNMLISNEINAGTGNNVFLLKGNDIIPLFNLDMVVVNDPNNFKYICINAKGGTFYLHLNGMGKGKVNISEGS
jgi:hypothetical protein